jgi:branched-chain amino acid transport system permease protein
VAVGLLQQYVNYYASQHGAGAGIGDLAVMLLLAVVLLVRPAGLGGIVATRAG